MSATESSAEEMSVVEGPIFVRRHSLQMKENESSFTKLKIPIYLLDKQPFIDIRYPLELYGVLDAQSWYNIVRYINDCLIIASPILQYGISPMAKHPFIYLWLTLAALLIVLALSRILYQSTPEPYMTIGCFFIPSALVSIMSLLVVRYTELFGAVESDLRVLRSSKIIVKKLKKLIKKDANFTKKILFPSQISLEKDSSQNLKNKIYHEISAEIPENYSVWLLNSIEYSLFKLRPSLEHFKIYSSVTFCRKSCDFGDYLNFFVEFVLDETIIFKEPSIDDFNYE